MEDKLFEELCESIAEAGAYLRGKIDLPEERITFAGEPDPREIRQDLNILKK